MNWSKLMKTRTMMIDQPIPFVRCMVPIFNFGCIVKSPVIEHMLFRISRMVDD